MSSINLATLTAPKVETKPKVFYKTVNNYYDYHLDEPLEVEDLSNLKSVDFPLCIDTEFVSLPEHWTTEYLSDKQFVEIRKTRQTGRLHISTQIKAITEQTGKIFISPHCSRLIDRHPILSTGFDPVDYLQSLGYEAAIERVTDKPRLLNRLPVLRFVMFAHFAVAEMMLIVNGDYWQDFESLVSVKEPRTGIGAPRFTLKRHLKAVTESVSEKTGRVTIKNHVLLNWVITLEGRKYRVAVEWVDSSAIHGIASYKDVCAVAGVDLLYKDNFTSEEKSKMLDMAIERPEDFDNYALGDLYVYEALVGNGEKFKLIYEALGIGDEFRPPQLTIGATVKNLFLSKLYKELGVNGRDEQEALMANYLSPVSAKTLRQNPGLTRALASKVEGGRCRSNRPTDWKIDGVLCDIDVSGCYAEGLRSQPYPIGNPEILDYEASNSSSYWTLEQFRKVYGSELVPGLWCARVWTREPLEYPQDFLASWFIPSIGHDLLGLAKYIQNLGSDTDQQGSENPEFDLEDGNLKIFNHEIINGVITHDFLDWLDNVATPRQRREMNEKLLIKVAIVYPKSWQVKGNDPKESYKNLLQEHSKHKDSDKVERVKRKGRNKLRREDGQYHGWFSINLGDLIIDDLLANRKLYPKKNPDGSKNPMNTAYKLCCNTLYGDMTSKYFDCANTIVGNNITARARAMVWYAEKGLHTVQSITDGGCFDLNKVVYPYQNRRVNGENLVNVYADKDLKGSRKIQLAPLGGCDEIRLTWDESTNDPILELRTGERVEVLKGYECSQWVDRIALEHIQTLFPKVPVLHSMSTTLKVKAGEDGRPVKSYLDRVGQFEFEMKAFYESAVFHGSANYLMTSPQGDTLKMRSYEIYKPHESVDSRLAVELETKDPVYIPFVTDRYGTKNNPAKDFMKGLLSGSPMARQVCFVKDAILKPNDYKEKRDKYQSLGLVPGDSFYKTGLLREFSISQFTFQNMEQFIQWEKKISRLKEKFGQSLERYFMSDKGLNFGEMVVTVDELVRSGVTDPIKALDEHRNASKGTSPTHPSFDTLITVRDLLGNSRDS